MQIRISSKDLSDLVAQDTGSGGRPCNTSRRITLPSITQGHSLLSGAVHGHVGVTPGPYQMAIISPPPAVLAETTPAAAVSPGVHPVTVGVPVVLTAEPRLHFCESAFSEVSNDGDEDVDYNTQQLLIAEWCLTPDINAKLDYGVKFNTADPIIDEEEEDNEEECANSSPVNGEDSRSFLETDNLSMKIVLFPILKETIKTNFCCKLCMLQ